MPAPGCAHAGGAHACRARPDASPVGAKYDAGFSAVVGAPAGRPSLPTRYTRLNGTALINGVALDTGSFTLPQAAARCEELAARGCVGFEVTNAPPPRPHREAL